MLNDFKNTKKQGDAGVGIAICYFTTQGYTVLIPLTDSQPYDLAIDLNGLCRVQVRTSKNIRRGKYQLNLRVYGGNRTGKGKSKLFDPNEVEYLFAVTQTGEMYLIPSQDIKAKHTLVLCSKWDKYKVNW